MTEVLSKTQTKLRIDALKEELAREELNMTSVEEQWKNVLPTFNWLRGKYGPRNQHFTFENEQFDRNLGIALVEELRILNQLREDQG